MVKTTNTQLDNDKHYKYGCNNDGYGNYAYRSEINGVKCHNSKRMNDQFDIQAEKLVSQLEFFLRDDVKHFTQHYFEQSAFRINPLKLINKIHMKLVEPHLKKNKLVHTSESVSYKKSEDLIPLNKPVITTHTAPVSPTKPTKPIKKKQVKQEIVEPVVTEPIINEFTNVPYESELSDIEDITDSPINYDSDSDSPFYKDTYNDIEPNNIQLEIDDTIILSDSNKYDIREICINYLNIIKPFHIVLKDFTKKSNKFTYMKVIYLEDDEPTFLIDSIDEFDTDFIIDRNKYNSGVGTDYYEIIIESKYNIHNDNKYK